MMKHRIFTLAELLITPDKLQSPSTKPMPMSFMRMGMLHPPAFQNGKPHPTGTAIRARTPFCTLYRRFIKLKGHTTF